MNLGRKLSVGAVTVGLSFGALTLGACGGTSPQTKAADAKSGEPDPQGDPTGGERPAGDTGGGEHTCGAGSCGK